MCTIAPVYEGKVLRYCYTCRTFEKVEDEDICLNCHHLTTEDWVSRLIKRYRQKAFLLSSGAFTEKELQPEEVKWTR